MGILEKFKKLGVDHAPGQEGRQKVGTLDIRGEKIPGPVIDYSHGNVDAFPPIPGSQETFIEGVNIGTSQAYTQYRGDGSIRGDLAMKLSTLLRTPIDDDREIILTAGTQGALFLAIGSTITHGDRVAYVEPDYFANRKLIEFFDAELVPIQMEWMKYHDKAGLDLAGLEEAFQSGVRVFLFSNPNNPTGVLYSREEVTRIAEMGKQYNATIIVDELYARQIYTGHTQTHLCSLDTVPENVVTIIGPSKTESMSGYRVGVAFGTASIIERMEKLQAIVSLRCGGYNQRVLNRWLCEPDGWLDQRIQAHQAIRDELNAILQVVPGLKYRLTEGGSYMFIRLPEMDVSLQDFIQILRIQAKVIVTPGTEFGPQFTDWFRINFSQYPDLAVQALQRTIRLMENYRK